MAQSVAFCMMMSMRRIKTLVRDERERERDIVGVSIVLVYGSDGI